MRLSWAYNLVCEVAFHVCFYMRGLQGFQNPKKPNSHKISTQASNKGGSFDTARIGKQIRFPLWRSTQFSSVRFRPVSDIVFSAFKIRFHLSRVCISGNGVDSITYGNSLSFHLLSRCLSIGKPLRSFTTYENIKVETPYHDNDMMLIPIIQPQSG